MALLDLLDSLSLQPSGALTGQAGAPLSIGIVPDVSQSTVSDIQLVDIDLEFIGKGVIFENNDLADTTILGSLPLVDMTHIPPTLTDGVQGLLGRIKGKMPVAVPSDIRPRLEVKWRVTDEEDNDLVASGDAVAPGGLNNPLLDILFLPEFVELTADLGDPGISRRRISAEVMLSAGGLTVGPRTLGPIEVSLPKIPLPTVLVMCVNKPYKGPTLIVVPGKSAVPDLGALTGKVQEIQTLLNPLRTVVKLASLFTGLDALSSIIGSEPHISFRKTDSIGNLNSITLVQRAWYQNDTEAEDELSSLFMIGPRRRSAEFFNKRHHESGDGKFTLTVGRFLYAGIRNLHAKNPASEPEGNEINVNKEPPGGWFSPDSFGDELSSARFT